MKKLCFLLCLTLVSFSFVACSKIEETDAKRVANQLLNTLQPVTILPHLRCFAQMRMKENRSLNFWMRSKLKQDLIFNQRLKF